MNNNTNKKELVKIRTLLSDVFNETYQLNIETLPKLSKAIDSAIKALRGQNHKKMVKELKYYSEMLNQEIWEEIMIGNEVKEAQND